jgi:hypothetical protein
MLTALGSGLVCVGLVCRQRCDAVGILLSLLIKMHTFVDDSQLQRVHG